MKWELFSNLIFLWTWNGSQLKDVGFKISFNVFFTCTHNSKTLQIIITIISQIKDDSRSKPMNEKMSTAPYFPPLNLFSATLIALTSQRLFHHHYLHPKNINNDFYGAILSRNQYYHCHNRENVWHDNLNHLKKATYTVQNFLPQRIPQHTHKQPSMYYIYVCNLHDQLVN